jgi:adsorption protein B
MITRQHFAGVVPGAGVGTAYSARAVQFASGSGEIFNTESLTEDYDFSFRLNAAGMRQMFACIPKGDPQDGLRFPFKLGQRNRSDIIATREYFPNAFWAAVRQKTRWFIGISLQGWQLLGWRGTWAIKYLFWRDRKMLFFSHAIVLGLLSFLIFSAFWVYHSIDPQGYRMAPLMAEDNPFWYVVYFNLFMLVYRIFQRSWWTCQYYGLSSLPLIIPRYVWGSIINYLATVRAIKIFFASKVAGKTIGWDKTAHEFPTQLHPVPLKHKSGAFTASSVGRSMPEH